MLHTHEDPFKSVDDSSDPVFEEQILLDRFAGTYYAAIADWFVGFLASQGSPSSVLEVGCGSGQLLERVCTGLGTTDGSGVDRSAFLATNAQSRYPQYRISSSDGRKLPFEDDSFDLAFAATVLVHSGDAEDIVAEMVRVVRPGGIVAVLDQDFETAVLHPGGRDLTRAVLQAAADYWSDGWIGRRVASMLARQGASDIAIDSKVRIDREYDDGFFLRIHDWITSAGFPEADAGRWLEALRSAPEDEVFLFTRNFYAVAGTV